MNQTNPTVDNDLQKAIDDITNSTNQDPVFADPVAAPSSVPEGDTGELAESVGPFPAPKPEPVEVAPVVPEPVAPEPAAPTADFSSTITDFSIPSISNPVETETTTTFTAETTTPNGLNIREVKTAALRDLAPLISKMSLSNSQKFKIYRDMFENLRDYTVIEPAYQAAKNIEDENERAEALLYLIESIDNM